MNQTSQLILAVFATPASCCMLGVALEMLREYLRAVAALPPGLAFPSLYEQDYGRTEL